MPPLYPEGCLGPAGFSAVPTFRIQGPPHVFCSISCIFALDRSASQSLPGTPPAETRDLWPAVTINATAQGNFGGPAAVERNKIFELDGIEPDFLQEFRTKLGQWRWIEPDTVCFFKSHTTLVIEFCHRALRFLKVYFPNSTTTSKTHPQA